MTITVKLHKHEPPDAEPAVGAEGYTRASDSWQTVASSETVTFIVPRITRAVARRLWSISRAERNRLAAGRRPRALTARQQDAVDRAAGLPRGLSVGTSYRITRIDENRITLS